MKARLPRVVLRAGFVVGAVAAAYLAGLSQRIVQHEAATIDATAKKQAEEARAQQAADQPQPKLSRDAAMQKILDGLNKDGDEIQNCLNDQRIDFADMPFLMEQLAKLPPSSKRDELLNDFFNHLVYDHPATALSLVGLIADPRSREQMASRIFAALAEKDPDLARQEIAKLPPGPQSLGAYQSVYQALAGDPENQDARAAAAAEAFNLPPGPNRTAALQGVIAGWAMRDIPALLDWAGSLPSSDSAVLKQALLAAGSGQIFTNAQPQLVAQYLDKLDDVSARNEIIEKIAGEMVTTRSGDGTDYHEFTFGSFSPADQSSDADQNTNGQNTSWTRASAALDWLNQVAKGETYDNAVQSVFNSLSDYETDPKMVADLLGKVTQPDLRDFAIAKMAGQWGQDDPQAALIWAQTLSVADATSRATALNSIVESWGEDDPKAALAWVQTQAPNDTPALKGALNSIVSNWVESDPEAAADYVQNSSDPSLFLPEAESIASQLAQEKPAAALAFAQSLPTGEDKNKALVVAIGQISGNDFPAAWQDAISLPDESSRDAVMSSLISSEAYKDPSKTADLIGQLTTPAAQIEAASNLAQNLAQANPQAATALVNSLPPGDPRDAALAQMVSAQMSADPDAALALANNITDPQAQAAQIQAVQLASQINQLPPGGPRDAAIVQLLPIQMQTNPESALAWAATISNPQVRSDQLQSAFVAWGSSYSSGTGDFDGDMEFGSSAAATEFSQLTDAQRAAVSKKIAAARTTSGKPSLGSSLSPFSPFGP